MSQEFGLRKLKPDSIKNNQVYTGIIRKALRKNIIVKPIHPLTIRGNTSPVSKTIESNRQIISGNKPIEKKSVNMGEMKLNGSRNPFINEKVIEHPVFGKGQFNLEPRLPSLRLKMNASNLNQKVDQIRRKAAYVNNGDIKTVSGFNNTKYPKARLTLSKRPKREYKSKFFNQDKLMGVRPPLKSVIVANPKQPLIWRGSMYSVQNNMYQHPTIKKDQKIETRKKQQEEWTERRKLEKERLSEKMKIILKMKNNQ